MNWIINWVSQLFSALWPVRTLPALNYAPNCEPQTRQLVPFVSEVVQARSRLRPVIIMPIPRELSPFSRELRRAVLKRQKLIAG